MSYKAKQEEFLASVFVSDYTNRDNYFKKMT